MGKAEGVDDQRHVKRRPQPDAHVIVLATLPSHEAPLLIGRLEEAGIRAMATPGGSSPGQWTALPSVPGLAAAAVRPGLVDVLIRRRAEC